MRRIVTATVNPAVDMSTSIDQVVPEHKLRCDKPTVDPGGGGINVARAIRRLGGQATALWSCGESSGETLAKLLDAEDVSHRGIHVAEATRQNITIYETSSEQQFRFTLPGPRLDAQEQERWLEELQGFDPAPDFLVASGSLPPGVSEDFYARIADHADSKCRVVIDTKGAALRASLQGSVYMVKPNLRELGELVGREISDDQDIRDAARKIIDDYDITLVVASLGRGGAVMVTADECEHIRSPTVPIRSKVGAGDSMVAGIVTALGRETSIPEAVRFGIAAGAAAVMTPGTELCGREDTERLFGDLRE